MGTKKWTAVDYDAAKYLASKVSGKLKLVTLPKVMSLQVVIELDEVLYKAVAKNPSTLAKLQQSAGDKAREAMDDALKKILQAELKAQKFDQKAANIFAKDLQASLEVQFEKVSKVMASEAAKVIEDYKKGQDELKVFRIKASGKIALNAVLMAGGIAISVATAGALSPLGIIGVVRTSVGIVQEAAKLASTADATAKLIAGELAVLKKIMVTEIDKATKAEKTKQGVKEVSLNLLSKAAGVELGSLKHCETHIALHKTNIAKLDKESDKLSNKIYEAMDEQEKLAKAFKAAKAKLPADKVGKASQALEKAEKALDSLLQATIKVNEKVEMAHKRQKLYEAALKSMKEGIPGWLKYVDTAVGLAADLAMGIADASNAAATAFAVVSTLESTLGSELIDAV